jgi:hypothetical protein
MADGYAGNTTFIAGGEDMTNPGDYVCGADIIMYNNAQKTAMAAYQMGDALTLTWADGSSAGPFNVMNTDQAGPDPDTSYIRTIQSTIPEPALGPDPLTITSVPERHPDAGGSSFELATSQWPTITITEHEAGTNGIEFAGYYDPAWPTQIMDNSTFNLDPWLTHDNWYDAMTGTGGGNNGGGGGSERPTEGLVWPRPCS